jgi:hypothetical protein
VVADGSRNRKCPAGSSRRNHPLPSAEPRHPWLPYRLGLCNPARVHFRWAARGAGMKTTAGLPARQARRPRGRGRQPGSRGRTQGRPRRSSLAVKPRAPRGELIRRPAGRSIRSITWPGMEPASFPACPRDPAGVLPPERLDRKPRRTRDEPGTPDLAAGDGRRHVPCCCWGRGLQSAFVLGPTAGARPSRPAPPAALAGSYAPVVGQVVPSVVLIRTPDGPGSGIIFDCRDVVLAVSYPPGLAGSVTEGIISATGRAIAELARPGMARHDAAWRHPG